MRQESISSAKMNRTPSATFIERITKLASPSCDDSIIEKTTKISSIDIET
jgi:hypothetical protein